MRRLSSIVNQTAATALFTDVKFMLLLASVLQFFSEYPAMGDQTSLLQCHGSAQRRSAGDCLALVEAGRGFQSVTVLGRNENL